MRKTYLPKPDDTPGKDPIRRVIRSPALDPSLARSADTFECIQLKEPELLFASGNRCVDPKTGIGAHGAYYHDSATPERTLRIGIVGSSQGIEQILELLDETSAPIEHDSQRDAVVYPAFPGLNIGQPFFTASMPKPRCNGP